MLVKNEREEFELVYAGEMSLDNIHKNEKSLPTG